MTRNRRTKILISGDGILRRRMAQDVREHCEVRMIEAASQALVMLTMRESARNSLFHPGEVLISEAKAQVDGALGLGMIVGTDSPAAEDLALIDGAWTAGCSLIQGWIRLLETEEEALLRLEGSRNAAIMQSRVDFQTMDTEAPL